ncbi:TIGR00645 family protein [Derxia lacustris]|uniref:TIGR00645 family protein n=1 Tax=Derxia lacustris TaxID=764842 RepID=UPI000A177CF3|nr:TIGR00645 family protein [Derxia lacustris]
MTDSSSPATAPRLGLVPRLIFASRWLQLPLYLGLILAQGVYVVHFWVELLHLLKAAMGSGPDAVALICSVTPGSEECRAGLAALADAAAGGHAGPRLTETLIMLVVLGLIDVVMISNLLIMVIVGGYETFVSRLGLEGHPDQPEWLSHVNASVLKVKLSTAIIGISSIHLLKTFINAANYDTKVLMWQTLIHVAFLVSALAIASVDRILGTAAHPEAH